MQPFHHLTKRFKDHVCVVTGGGRGIGRACALRLAQEGGIVYILDNKQWKDSLDQIKDAQHGFHDREWEITKGKQAILLSDKSNKNNKNIKIKKRKPRCAQKVFHIRCNVTEEKAVKEAIEEIIKERGFIDVVLNCVNTTGTDYLNKHSHEVKLSDFERIMKLNVYSTIAVCNTVIPYMQKEQYGRIVNLAAYDGKAGSPKCLSYSTAKAAIISLTKVYGKEYAGTGITVNCVAPQYDDYHIKKLQQKGHKSAKEASEKVPMGRAIEMEELAGCVAFIASEENTYTTGFCYDLSGGTSTF